MSNLILLPFYFLKIAVYYNDMKAGIAYSDNQNSDLIEIRSELEQKRRGFHLLTELSVSLRQSSGSESVFAPAARRINAALNMQRTVVLEKDG